VSFDQGCSPEIHTQSVYVNHWKRWSQWFVGAGVDPLSLTAIDIANNWTFSSLLKVCLQRLCMLDYQQYVVHTTGSGLFVREAGS
jgi:hypothetical protein